MKPIFLPGAGELKFGELAVEAPPTLETDGLEKLVLTRGLLTCCKTDILSCQLESFTHKVGEHKPNSQGCGEPLAQGWQPPAGAVVPRGCSQAALLCTSSFTRPAGHGVLARSLLFPKTSEWGFPSPGRGKKTGGAKSSLCTSKLAAMFALCYHSINPGLYMTNRSLQLCPTPAFPEPSRAEGFWTGSKN